MATHPDAPCFVPLFCRAADAADAAAAAPQRLPSPLPAAPPDPEGRDRSDDSLDRPVFMDFVLANMPPNAPLMPRAHQPPAFAITRSTSEGSSLGASTTTSPPDAGWAPPWLLRQRAERRARLLLAGLPAV